MRIFVSGTVLVCLLALAAPSHATVTSYMDATLWNAAVAPGASGINLEDFQGFTTDTSFRSSAVTGSFFTIQQSGSGTFRNKIDVPPFGDPATPLPFTDNNGTTNAGMFTDYGVTKVDMIFSNPIFAWGADFFGPGDREKVDLDLVLPGGTILTTLQVRDTDGFFGFAITGPVQTINKIAFKSHANDDNGGEGFGLDNVKGASPLPPDVIPAPGAMLLSTIGAGLIGWLRRRRTL